MREISRFHVSFVVITSWAGDVKLKLRTNKPVRTKRFIQPNRPPAVGVMSSNRNSRGLNYVKPVQRVFRNTGVMKKVRIYEYSKCSTCRNALRFLDRNGIAYDKVPIFETPPTTAELKTMLVAQAGNVKKLFNTSGEVYREMKLGTRLDSMSNDEALDLLAANGRLVKRPFVLFGDAGILGFQEEAWNVLFRSED